MDEAAQHQPNSCSLVILIPMAGVLTVPSPQTIGTIQMDGPRITQVIHLMTVDFFNRQGHLLWSRVQSTELLGVIWARATSGDNLASIELIRLADDKAQALFDNCFKVLNGPDAPDVEVIELDKELVLNLSNGSTSNNFLEAYVEFDPLIISPPGESWDPFYRFQGYQLYQLASPSVSVTDLENADLARLVHQSDVLDEVESLVNYDFDAAIGANVPTLEVSASNEGISHSVSITEDKFAIGDKKLVNNKTYYFMAVAYGYNQYKEYDPNNPNKLDGQQKPYKAGRKNIKVYSGIPHKPFTTIYNAEIGDGVEIKRILGLGNGTLIELKTIEILALKTIPLKSQCTSLDLVC